MGSGTASYPNCRAFSELPPGPWRWTNDTHMALSIVEILRTYGRIEQDALAAVFARRYMEEPYRGYARGTRALLGRIAEGEDWRNVSPTMFGEGSYGNGAAMRVAPLGGYFSGNPPRTAEEARLSAHVTRAHPEGQAGAIAVAVAASVASSPMPPRGREFISKVLEFVPESLTRRRTEMALDIPPDRLYEAVRELGSGNEVTAQDTVPFCVWCAAYHLDNFVDALWWTVKGLGDRDTTCAIVGGIVALSAHVVPSPWVERRESLP